MKSFHDIFGSAAWEKTTKRFGGRDIDEFSPMTLVQFGPWKYHMNFM